MKIIIENDWNIIGISGYRTDRLKTLIHLCDNVLQFPRYDSNFKKFWCPNCKEISSEATTLIALLHHVNNKAQKFDGEPKDNK